MVLSVPSYNTCREEPGTRTEGTTVDFNDLAAVQREKAKACKTAEELVALAEAEGIDLSDEELDGIAGGNWCNQHGIHT